MPSDGKGKGRDKGKGGADGRPRPVRPCPVCGKPATRAAWPFCSERCRDVDLHRWLSGSYVIPGRDDDEETPG